MILINFPNSMSVYTNKSTLTYLVFKNTPVDKRNNQCFLKLKNLKKNITFLCILSQLKYLITLDLLHVTE